MGVTVDIDPSRTSSRAEGGKKALFTEAEPVGHHEELEAPLIWTSDSARSSRDFCWYGGLPCLLPRAGDGSRHGGDGGIQPTLECRQGAAGKFLEVSIVVQFAAFGRRLVGFEHVGCVAVAGEQRCEHEVARIADTRHRWGRDLQRCAMAIEQLG